MGTVLGQHASALGLPRLGSAWLGLGWLGVPKTPLTTSFVMDSCQELARSGQSYVDDSLSHCPPRPSVGMTTALPLGHILARQLIMPCGRAAVRGE